MTELNLSLEEEATLREILNWWRAKKTAAPVARNNIQGGQSVGNYHNPAPVYGQQAPQSIDLGRDAHGNQYYLKHGKFGWYFDNGTIKANVPKWVNPSSATMMDAIKSIKAKIQRQAQQNSLPPQSNDIPFGQPNYDAPAMQPLETVPAPEMGHGDDDVPF